MEKRPIMLVESLKDRDSLFTGLFLGSLPTLATSRTDQNYF